MSLHGIVFSVCLPYYTKNPAVYFPLALCWVGGGSHKQPEKLLETIVEYFLQFSLIYPCKAWLTVESARA